MTPGLLFFPQSPRLNDPLDTNLLVDLTPTSPLLPDVGNLLLVILLMATQLFMGDQSRRKRLGLKSVTHAKS